MKALFHTRAHAPRSNCFPPGPFCNQNWQQALRYEILSLKCSLGDKYLANASPDKHALLQLRESSQEGSSLLEVRVLHLVQPQRL
jgi:hypothetical protein